MAMMTGRWVWLWSVVWVGLAWGCVGGEELGVTEPCVADCNEGAVVGSGCAAAEDCAAGQFCNLAFPAGYCQASCEELEPGAACGEGQGICVGSGEAAGCLATCDPAEATSCGRAEASCYAQPSGGGVCHVRCGQDADCGDGLACDGAGVCQVASGSCNGLTDGGCAASSRCAPSEGGVFFCGAGGASRKGEGCGRSAQCSAGLLCIQGACAERCDGEDTYSCGELGGCVTLEARTGLGYCPR